MCVWLYGTDVVHRVHQRSGRRTDLSGGLAFLATSQSLVMSSGLAVSTVMTVSVAPSPLVRMSEKADRTLSVSVDRVVMRK